MRDDRQEEVALRVGGDVPLAALDPLACIVAALPPFWRRTVVSLAMIAMVGSGSRPALMRTWHRKHRVWCEWPMYTWDIVVMQ